MAVVHSGFVTFCFRAFLQLGPAGLREPFPQGSCTPIVYTLAPKNPYLATILRPKYNVLFGYVDP